MAWYAGHENDPSESESRAQKQMERERSFRPYRKKPVTVMAQRYIATAKSLPPGVCLCGKPESPHCHTLEGPLHVSDGDWIIQGVKGEFYPCKPDVFAATYAPA